MDHAARLQRFVDSDLYVVLTEQFCAGRPWVSVAEQALAAGVRIVQLREKGISDLELFRRAKVARQLCDRYETLLIINDRVDIALTCGADGVHLGQDDLPIEPARALAPELLIGASTHDLGEALEAQANGASVLNIGPIFDTNTKELPMRSLGPERIAAIAPQLSVPWSVMGGIKDHNIDRVLERGAEHIAVVTAVTAAHDVGMAVERLRSAILAARAR